LLPIQAGMGNATLRRIIVSALGAAVGLALLASPAAAALSLTVYRPAATPAGSYVSIKAKATPRAYCAIGIAGVLNYGSRKYASSNGNVSWRPRVPSSATAGDHVVKVSCVKGGKRVTRYTALVVTRTFEWSGTFVPDKYSQWDFSVRLRIPTVGIATLELCNVGTYGSLFPAWWPDHYEADSWYRWLDGSPVDDCARAAVVTEGRNWGGTLTISARSAIGGYPRRWRVTVSGVANTPPGTPPPSYN
jgi:hypothetical protein